MSLLITEWQYTHITIVKNPSDMRKAFLGFLLRASLYNAGDKNWDKDEKNTVVFSDTFPKSKQQQQQSGDGGAGGSVDRKITRSAKRNTGQDNNPNSGDPMVEFDNRRKIFPF